MNRLITISLITISLSGFVTLGGASIWWVLDSPSPERLAGVGVLWVIWATFGLIFSAVKDNLERGSD